MSKAKTRIELTEEAKIIATFAKTEAIDTTPADNATLENLVKNVTAGKEDRDGKPELGVKDAALAFALYKRWRKIRNLTEE